MQSSALYVRKHQWPPKGRGRQADRPGLRRPWEMRSQHGAFPREQNERKLCGRGAGDRGQGGEDGGSVNTFTLGEISGREGKILQNEEIVGWDHGKKSSRQ